MIERIEAEKGTETIDRGPLAEHLLGACFAFYEDPENEKAFQEWMRERNGGEKARGRRGA